MVINLRELFLASQNMTLQEMMTAPVVSVLEDAISEDLPALFAKYRYRMNPIVDGKDRILGVIFYNDIMKNVEMRVKI